MHRIGIDLGGTKISGVLLDGEGHRRAQVRVATPKEDYPRTLAAIGDVVTRLEQDGDIAAGSATVGLGVPGALSPRTGLIKNANSTWLIGMPLDRDLAAALGRPVRLANDANCLAVSEAVDGAGEGAHIVFGVILGTGCGGGLAIDARAVTGLNAIAGEWGHNPLPWPTPDEYPGRPCYCGKLGCIETWLSGPAIAADHRAHTGLEQDVAEIAAAAKAGNAAADATLGRHRNRLARALSSVVNILDPDVIVVGGGVSQLSGLTDSLAAMLSEWCFSDGVSTPVRRARHGDDSGVRGAAWLWSEEHGATEGSSTP